MGGMEAFSNYKWSDTKTLCMFVTHKHKFVFVLVKELFCVPKTPSYDTNVIRD